jgi:hypothetical protein
MRTFSRKVIPRRAIREGKSRKQKIENGNNEAIGTAGRKSDCVLAPRGPGEMDFRS